MTGMDKIEKFFAEHGVRLEMDKAMVLPLNQPDACWFVASGAVGVTLGDGSTRFVARAGEMLFGGGRGSCLKMSGLPLAVVFKLEKTPPELCKAPGFAPLVDAYIQTATMAVDKKGDRPLGKRILQVLPNRTGHVKRRQILRAKQDVVWVRYREGASLYYGLEKLEPDSGWIPLAGPGWLRMVTSTEIETASTLTLMERGELAASLAGFQVIASRRLTPKVSGSGKGTRRNGQMAGLRRLGSVMDSSAPEYEQPENANDLVAALALAAHDLGLNVQWDTLNKVAVNPWDIEEVAEAVGLRVRRVSLRKGWHREDLGHLVGILNKNGRYVALLPDARRKYRLADPGVGTNVPLSADKAAALADTAYLIYRPLPENIIKLWEIFLFALQGSGMDLVMVLSIGLFTGLAGLITPLLTENIINFIIPSAEKGLLLQTVAILVGFTVTSVLLSAASSIYLVRMRGRVDHGLEVALWDRVLKLPVSFFRKYTAGDLAQRTTALGVLQAKLSTAVIGSTFSGFFSMAYLILLFYYNVQLALIALGATLISVFLTVIASIYQIRHDRLATKISGKLSGKSLQIVSGIVKIRTSGAEDKALDIWSDGFADQRRHQYISMEIGNALSAFGAFFSIIVSGLVFFGVLYFNGNSPLSTGAFLAFWVAFGGVQSGLLKLVTAATSILHAMPYYERLLPLITTKPEATEGKASPGTLTGRIEISNLCFRYAPDMPQILKNVSLSVDPGEFVAITGPTGSGKSTLLRMLLGFHPPDTGTVMYNDLDLSELDIFKVRRQLGVVLQGGGVFPGSIRSNITGASDLPLEDAWEAARMAGLDKDIRQMPMGMGTVVSEGASTLSGGQRQRLLIARAMVRKPKILFFDEATSYLDNRTQKEVAERIASLSVTRIVVAHRLSTIVNADSIYVMVKGEIEESGTYEDLMQKKNIFYDLVSRQTLDS